MHYAVTTHTDARVNSKCRPKIFIKILGDVNKTEFIPLQHSQTNKQPFLSGKRDIFNVTAPDVGRIKKVILRNEDNITNFWSFDSFEIRTINDGHIYK